MKKSLIVMAVAAAIPALAQAQSSVTMYGIADAGVMFTDKGGTAKSAMLVDSGVQSTSRFGIRGTEDLGGGLKAVFNFEAGMRVDDGTAAGLNFTRRSVVGLEGGFGSILLGRDYTPGFSAGGVADVMGYGLYGNWLGFTVVGALAAGTIPGYTAHGALQHGVETRASNAIQYYTPTVGGLQLKAMYAMGERSAAPTTGGNLMGAHVSYVAGPVAAAAYYQQLKSCSVTTPACAGTALSNNQYGLGGGYNFGAFRLTANFGVADPAGSNNKHTGMSVGAGIKLGAGELLAQVISQKVATGAATEPKSTTIGLAFVQPMSKRTNWYVTAGKTSNNAAGNFALRSSDNTIAPTAVGNDPTGFGVGIRHQF